MDATKLSERNFDLLSRTMKEIRAAIPAQYFVLNTFKATSYLARDLALACCAWTFATAIDPCFAHLIAGPSVLSPVLWNILRLSAWSLYWWFQGLIFTGIWVLGHECGHGAFSLNKTANDTIGFVIHSLLFTPYFSWKISHHRHHVYHASMTRDETYVPSTRSDRGIPQDTGDIDYDEIFGDTPLYTLFLLIRQQLVGFPAYLLFNVSGQQWYPKGTNHFNPASILFTPNQRKAVVLSNLGVGFATCCLIYAVSILGPAMVVNLYVIPWLLVTHWFVMITYLQHTDPGTPHFRGPAWTFQRGAVATVDRPNFLGWQGSFFLHNVVQCHTIHHAILPQDTLLYRPRLNPRTTPLNTLDLDNAPQATRHLKAFLGDHYVSSDTPAFQALWDNYNRCQFVEDQGDVVFYKDKQGRSVYRDA